MSKLKKSFTAFGEILASYYYLFFPSRIGIGSQQGFLCFKPKRSKDVASDIFAMFRIAKQIRQKLGIQDYLPDCSLYLFFEGVSTFLVCCVSVQKRLLRRYSAIIQITPNIENTKITAQKLNLNGIFSLLSSVSSAPIEPKSESIYIIRH